VKDMSGEPETIEVIPDREILLIVDRSGSMRGTASDAEGGIATFLDEQREVGLTRPTYVTLVQFDDEYEVVYSRVPLAEVPEYKLRPRNQTALLGAVGKAIRTKRDEHKALKMPKELWPTVDVVIATDGYENTSHNQAWSRKWTLDKVHKLLTKAQSKWGWHITYVGATMDAVKVAESMGISSKMSMQYAPTNTGTHSSWAAAGTMMSRGAVTDWADAGYTEAERSLAMDEPQP